MLSFETHGILAASLIRIPSETSATDEVIVTLITFVISPNSIKSIRSDSRKG
ncbi:MAG: hypothetical protein JWM11_7802 [Planctomycetaceae bacterium]|nr:hypothetical protein [Planctomycetaceae bacterium]